MRQHLVLDETKPFYSEKYLVEYDDMGIFAWYEPDQNGEWRAIPVSDIKTHQLQLYNKVFNELKKDIQSQYANPDDCAFFY